MPPCKIIWKFSSSTTFNTTFQAENLGRGGGGVKQILDQYQYLGNCAPTPPLTQQQFIDNKLGWMLG